MLLLILDKRLPLDEVIFYDTGMEFQAIYNIRDKVKELLRNNGIKYTELKPQSDFRYDMIDRVVHKRNGTTAHGYGWCGGACRWGTMVKMRMLNQYTKGGHIYVGIAADEQNRLARLDINKSSPIAEAGMTEHDCLEYCYRHGFNWNEDGVELYSILDRVSCWCCKNKNLKELRNIYHHLPNYWDKLKDLQSQIYMPMKGQHGSVFDLERRFRLEDDWLREGRKITTRDFYNALSDLFNDTSIKTNPPSLTLGGE